MSGGKDNREKYEISVQFGRQWKEGIIESGAIHTRNNRFLTLPKHLKHSDTISCKHRNLLFELFNARKYIKPSPVTVKALDSRVLDIHFNSLCVF